MTRNQRLQPGAAAAGNASGHVRRESSQGTRVSATRSSGRLVIRVLFDVTNPAVQHRLQALAARGAPFGGVLTPEQADTSKTAPGAAERAAFLESRNRADRNTGHTAAGGPASSKIAFVKFGRFEMRTWYTSPYPEEYSRKRVLHVCEFCLKYMGSEHVAVRHKLKCGARYPPGREIYRDGAVSVFEVDGRRQPVYCQNVCLLAKMFLQSKSLYYDVEPFLFYVVTEADSQGCHFVGYFSKEKRTHTTNNVSCILTLPAYQRRGYGQFLIDFSYCLTRVEGKLGSPEKPLSDLGLLSYRSYWRWRVCRELLQLQQRTSVSIDDLTRAISMTADDVISALEALGVLMQDRDTGNYRIEVNKHVLQATLDRYQARAYLKVQPQCLKWVPLEQAAGRGGER